MHPRIAVDVGSHTEPKQLRLTRPDAAPFVPRSRLMVTAGSTVPWTRPGFPLVEILLSQLPVGAPQIGRQCRRDGWDRVVTDQVVVELGITRPVPLLSGLELSDPGVARSFGMISQQMPGQMSQELPEFLDAEPVDRFGGGMEMPGGIHGDRVALGPVLDGQGEQGAGQVRHAGRCPQPGGRHLVVIEGHELGQSRRPASRNSGAKAVTCDGIGAPLGRLRASVRAAAAATSGA